MLLKHRGLAGVFSIHALEETPRLQTRSLQRGLPLEVFIKRISSVLPPSRSRLAVSKASTVVGTKPVCASDFYKHPAYSVDFSIKTIAITAIATSQDEPARHTIGAQL